MPLNILRGTRIPEVGKFNRLIHFGSYFAGYQLEIRTNPASNFRGTAKEQGVSRVLHFSVVPTRKHSKLDDRVCKMSYTDTQCVASDGLSHVPEVGRYKLARLHLENMADQQVKTALRNYAQVEGVEQSVEDTRPSLRLTMFSSREEILAFLMADPPKQTSSDTNEAAAAPNTDHRPGKENEDSGMQRDQSMVALKQELAEIDTNADDELFKFSNLK